MEKTNNKKKTHTQQIHCKVYLNIKINQIDNMESWLKQRPCNVWECPDQVCSDLVYFYKDDWNHNHRQLC